jgi:hypothetical protein
MAFMDNYEGNKERTDRWIATFPQGRLEAHIVEFNAEKGYVLIQAKAWRTQEETEPAGVDYAFGYREAYPEKMRRWMIEDTTHLSFDARDGFGHGWHRKKHKRNHGKGQCSRCL